MIFFDYAGKLDFIGVAGCAGVGLREAGRGAAGGRGSASDALAAGAVSRGEPARGATREPPDDRASEMTSGMTERSDGEKRGDEQAEGRESVFGSCILFPFLLSERVSG